MDMQMFCEKQTGSQFNIKEPWSVRGFSYATDGIIVIRVPRIDSVPEKTNVPDAETPFNSVKKPEVFYDLPEVNIEMVTCEYCSGVGKFDGFMCDECDGDGKYPNPQDVEIGGVLFQDVYIDKIKQLPGATIGPTGEKHPAWFKFDGGDGLLMPLKPGVFK